MTLVGRGWIKLQFLLGFGLGPIVNGSVKLILLKVKGVIKPVAWGFHLRLAKSKTA